MYNLLSIYACLSQVVLVVKNLSAVLETSEVQVQSLGQEDPLEEELVPTPVLFLGKSHGQRSLVGCSPWGHKELDTTELLSRHIHTHAFNTCIFSARDIPSLLSAGALGSTSAVHLGAIQNANSPTKSTEMRKTWH